VIGKFAISEARALMRQHSQLIYQWAEGYRLGAVSEENKEALTACCCRLYELIQALPGYELPTTTDPETGEKVTING